MTRKGKVEKNSETGRSEEPSDVLAALAEEGLRYVSDKSPGYRRKRHGTSFAYLDLNGKRITDRAIVRRIKSIGIPPAYERVWICASPTGHIQATGFDARERKQYRYHPKWRELRDQNKYEHMLQFAATLPMVRRQVAADMRRKGLPSQKVLATIIWLLEKTLVRIGNAEYAARNGSFGLTTLRRKHAGFENGALRFEFTGKSGKRWKLQITDKRIVSVVKRCADMPGYELFKYIDGDGEIRAIDSADVNAYIKDITSQNFTAKDFRTWAGTVLAAVVLSEFAEFDNQTEAKRNAAAAIRIVAKQLGNTPAICRKCYVHPQILDAYMSGGLTKINGTKISRRRKQQYAQLAPEEIMVLTFLQKRLAH